LRFSRLDYVSLINLEQLFSEAVREQQSRDSIQHYTKIRLSYIARWSS